MHTAVQKIFGWIPLLCTLFALPFVIHAACPEGQYLNYTTGECQSTLPGDTGSGATQNPGICAQGELCNPIGSRTVEELIIKIIDILLVFATPLIVLFIMYSGFLYVTARGEPGKISEAKSALIWSIIGGVIILSAKIIIEVIKGTVTAL